MGSILSTSSAKNTDTQNEPDNIVPNDDAASQPNETTTTTTSSSSSSTSRTNNDFIIRDGFPVLFCVAAMTAGTEDTTPPPLPNINDIEDIPQQSFWTTTDDAPLLLSSSSSITNSTWWEEIQQDCQVVFDARTRLLDVTDEVEATTATTVTEPQTTTTAPNTTTPTTETEYSEGTTYFLPCCMKPRCSLEQIVAAIFQYHTKHMHPSTFLPQQSGAEWWTLVLDNNSKNDTTDSTNNTIDQTDDDDDDDDDEDEVGLHFDADYGLEHQIRNMMIHPRLATVTYMSGGDNGDDTMSPTIIYNVKSPNSLPNVKDHRNPKVALTCSVQPIDTVWISYPRTGKHIAFDGRLLHGATSVFSARANHESSTDHRDHHPTNVEERPTKKHKTDATMTTTTATTTTTRGNSASKSTPRITLMVNIWLNHCPLDAEPIDDEIVGQLTTPFDGSKTLPCWNDTVYSSSTVDHANDSSITKMDITALSNNVAVHTEDIILCNHSVTVTYDTALIDALHHPTPPNGNHTAPVSATRPSNLQLNIKDPKLIQIEVHEEIPESDDDNDDE